MSVREDGARTEHGAATVAARAIALTIAGSDSGGGAGIQADLKTFHRFGVFGTTVITAVTAQNTLGVTQWEPVGVELIQAQCAALATDLPPAAGKSGMLGTEAVVLAIAEALGRFTGMAYVLDPVMVATSGDLLVNPGTVARIREHLVPRASLVTPNLDEAQVLLESPVSTLLEMEAAAQALVHDMGAQAALVKGGHLRTPEMVDVLYCHGELHHFPHPRIATTNLHGTGCTLSAAITALRARGIPMVRAVSEALDFVQLAIGTAPGLGAGHGPLNHWA